MRVWKWQRQLYFLRFLVSFSRYNLKIACGILIVHTFTPLAAVALPVTILKTADVIDNPWQIAVDRSKKAGVGRFTNKLAAIPCKVFTFN